MQRLVKLIRRRPQFLVDARLLLYATATVGLMFLFGGYQSASAEPVTFMTTGTFSNISPASGCTGNGTNTINCAGGKSLSYNPFTIVTIDSTERAIGGGLAGGAADVGSFILSVNGVPQNFGVINLPDDITFTLTISQVTPFTSSGSIIGGINGGVLTFSNPPLVFQNFTYQPGNVYVDRSNPLTLGISSPIPEPTTIILLSTGLAGMGAGELLRRKSKNKRA